MACTRRILKQKPRLAISMSVKAPPAEKERIIVGRPLPFSVFGAEGQLLLAEGSVAESDRARQMLLRKGVYRDAVSREDTTPDTAFEPAGGLAEAPLSAPPKDYGAASQRNPARVRNPRR